MSGLDLYLAQRTLALLFVYAAWAGFGMGVVYDILRISRMLLGAAGFSPSKGVAFAWHAFDDGKSRKSTLDYLKQQL